MFENRGLVSIVGKSGSGKSTILNMIAKLDNPTDGIIYYDNKDINSLNKKAISDYYKNDIQILFQNYNLIENETVLFNVSLPLQINGLNKTKSQQKARELLSYVGIEEEMFNKKASLLSGGEKQRVSLARTMINEPDTILCDEPTGALDSNNSSNVMDLLKEYSKEKLVIVVSHNLQQVNKYSDRIIEIKNGKIESDKIINKTQDKLPVKEKKSKKSKSWINELSLSNLKRRFKRNLFSFFALLISSVSAFISIGFISGKDASIMEASRRQLDYASGTISKTEEISKGNLFSLTRSTRPDINYLLFNENIRQKFDISLNFDSIMPMKPHFEYDGLILENVYAFPVYSFDKAKIDYSLIKLGKMPSNDSLKEIIINEKAYENIKLTINKDPLGETIIISNNTGSTYVDFDNTYVTDYFNYYQEATIVGVVDELDYLQEAKVYYSYSAFEEYTKEYLLPNLSTYFGYDISWYDRIYNADNNDSLTAFSYRLFLKNHNDETIFNDDYFGDLDFSSSSLLIQSSLLNFMEVAKYGLILFLIVTLIGTILIMGIMAFTSYSEDHKTSAILTCLGATIDEISEIYLNESLLTGFLSLIVSTIASYLLSMGVNTLIYRFVGLKNLIAIPFYSFLNIPYLLPLLAIVSALLICSFVTLVPIHFSKRVSLKEELQSL